MTVSCRKAIKVLLLYINVCLSVKLGSSSVSYILKTTEIIKALCITRVQIHLTEY